MDHHVQALEEDGGMQQLVRERGRRIKAAAELGLARSSRGREWGRALGRHVLVPRKDLSKALPATLEKAKSLEQRGDEEEEEEEVVDEKVALLRHLVPGGEEMPVEGLLEETADYIAALKAQVGVMRALACLLSGSGLDVPLEKAAVLATPEKSQ
ncbi:transcription factor IBH1-like [Phragmites australis]|uniref:transcription factor IBH1-like n=1 Tax=Phragmites australis TaxID=29695 RepID=UPI002D78D791|nr:transcription factor IBH1-like [Phragmites australis]